VLLLYALFAGTLETLMQMFLNH